MKKSILVLALVALVLGFWFTRSRLPQSTPSTSEPTQSRTITDMRDRTFPVADPLERIALLGGPTGQVAFILGVQDQLCAVTNTLKMSQLVREIHPRIATLPGPRTTCGSIQIEELIASAPDLVIAGDIDGDIVLEKTRIPVAFLEDTMGEGVADMKREIRFYGYLFQTPERAETYVNYLDNLIDLVHQRTRDIPESEKVSVFQGFSPSHLVTLGGDTFMEERIRLAGCKNAAQSVTTIGKKSGLHSGLGEVSMEQVLDWNPDILVVNFGSLEELQTDPQWQNIDAVRNGRVYHQPAGVFLFNRPTMESAALFPLWLAGLAYPERFADLSIPGIVKDFYETVMGFDLSDQQVADILAGKYEFRLMKGIRHQKK